MKKWNAPEVAELNISETANGLFNAEIETPWIFNDKKCPENPDPVTPDDHS